MYHVYICTLGFYKHIFLMRPQKRVLMALRHCMFGQPVGIYLTFDLDQNGAIETKKSKSRRSLLSHITAQLNNHVVYRFF